MQFVIIINSVVVKKNTSRNSESDSVFFVIRFGFIVVPFNYIFANLNLAHKTASDAILQKLFHIVNYKTFLNLLAFLSLTGSLPLPAELRANIPFGITKSAFVTAAIA